MASRYTYVLITFFILLKVMYQVFRLMQIAENLLKERIQFSDNKYNLNLMQT